MSGQNVEMQPNRESSPRSQLTRVFEIPIQRIDDEGQPVLTKEDRIRFGYWTSALYGPCQTVQGALKLTWHKPYGEKGPVVVKGAVETLDPKQAGNVVREKIFIEDKVARLGRIYKAE